MDQYNPDGQNIIWNQAKSGDRNAFQKIYELHFKDLLNYGSYLCRHEVMVEDAIHDVFVNLHRYRSKLADNVNMKHYLFSCLRRQLTKSKNTFFIHINHSSEFDQYHSSVDCKEAMIIHNESDQQVLQALKSELGQLTPHQREIIYLRFCQDLSYDQIADVMRISVNSSRTLLYRSIKLLRTKLSNMNLDTIPNMQTSEYKSSIFSAIIILIIG